jgi:DNA-binding transcriptional ArsR family regulator
MVNPNQVAQVAQLIGEPARAAMLIALIDGKALTASELAQAAGVTPQTASGHLARLAAADLLKVNRQGRHRYHRLASADVARMLESLMQTATRSLPSPRKVVTGLGDRAMRRARTCYDHLAGELGVAIADALIATGAIEFEDEAGLVTPAGLEFAARHGFAPHSSDKPPRTARALCRPCLDWSERRPHLAGRLGAAICARFLEDAYVRRIDGTRALTVTPKGQTALKKIFGITGFHTAGHKF